MALTQEEQRRLVDEQLLRQQQADAREQHEAPPPGQPVAAARQTEAQRDKAGHLLSHWAEGAEGAEAKHPHWLEERERLRKKGVLGNEQDGGDGGHKKEDPRPGVTSDFDADTQIAAGERLPLPGTPGARGARGEDAAKGDGAGGLEGAGAKGLAGAGAKGLAAAGAKGLEGAGAKGLDGRGAQGVPDAVGKGLDDAVGAAHKGAGGAQHGAADLWSPPRRRGTGTGTAASGGLSGDEDLAPGTDKGGGK